ncbi:hypothetical protein WDU94_010570, partial [Cyamophila willieti]
ELIRHYGYPGEEHKVTTEDGYILTNFRIANPGGYPILIMHGLSATCDCWMLRDPSVDMVFRLWRRGYDVWLWNARGNLYSQEHVNLTHTDNRFYKFSMTELGIYDTTATIDYILANTGFKDVITLGHSMATGNVLIATSLRPEYQDKVRLNMLWGQSIFIGNMQSKGEMDIVYTQYVVSET